jgi:copper chaperone CopZ
MKRIILTILLCFLANPAFANHSAIDIKVNGMVCDFCAQSVWKVFQDYEQVENVDISLDEGRVTITLKDGQSLSDEELHKGIEYAGYDLVKITHRKAPH